MKTIESMTFRHGATLAREASTRKVALKPVSEMTLVITNKVEGLGAESTAIVTVELCPLRMRQIAENLIAAADDLEATVGPLLNGCCTPPELGNPPGHG
jgi:hypothetical protein